MSGAKVRVGIDAAGRGMAGKNHLFSHLVGLPEPGLHMVEQNLRVLTSIGIPVREMRVTLSCDAADRALVRDRLAVAGLAEGEFFHAHLTSRWMFKTMPPATAAGLIDLLASRTGLPAIFTAAPAAKEREYLQRILDVSTAPRLDLGGALSLKQLGALAGLARFFVGVDSAPMHMAAAVGTPVFGVFGPSTVTHWGPWDNRLMTNPYRASRGIQSTGRNFVLQSAVPCVPCSHDGCNGSKISACLDFSETDLQAAVEEFLVMTGFDRRNP
jgi:heptosyltransferase-3